MGNQAELLSDRGGVSVFRNQATGEKTSFVAFPVFVDGRRQYYMEPETHVVSTAPDGREEVWQIVCNQMPYTIDILLETDDRQRPSLSAALTRLLGWLSQLIG